MTESQPAGVNQSVKAHLERLFEFSVPTLSDKDTRRAAADRAEWIASKLLRKRFRRGPLHPDTVEDVRQKVRLSISQDEPIYVIVCFGGYKHF